MAKSGWDFSNRWLSALGDFATRSTIPVDLNLFLCNVESTLHRMHKLAGSAKQAATYDGMPCNCSPPLAQPKPFRVTFRGPPGPCRW